MNQALLTQIAKEAKGIRDKILKKQKPSMKFPLRNLSNVKFDPKAGYFQIGSKTKERTLAVSTVKTFAQSLKMITLSKKLIETDDIATKREAYYVAKGWAQEVRFAEQTESDAVLDDVEAFFSVNREQLGFVPEEKGGEVKFTLVSVSGGKKAVAGGRRALARKDIRIPEQAVKLEPTTHAKKVRTDTDIGANAVSVAFAAVQLAKHIFSALGSKVVELHRKTFAGLGTGKLKPGKFRKLKKTEIQNLYRFSK